MPAVLEIGARDFERLCDIEDAAKLLCDTWDGPTSIRQFFSGRSRGARRRRNLNRLAELVRANSVSRLIRADQV